ncbi:MAG: radical SAM protein [Elusimicrobia bacterium]|nr:radical SAM protein [Elusimicrobiota bacterium]
MTTRLWLRLSYACNNRCLFCLDGDQNDPGRFVPFQELVRSLAAGRRSGMRRVVLSGGEPTLHPRFVDVVRRAAKLGYTHPQVITNGRRFCYPRFLRACVGAGLAEATFSMHGHTAALHDRLVGVPGAFVQSVAGLVAALATPGLIVSVDVVLNRLNAGVIDDLIRFYVRLGVREFDLLQLVPFGRGWDHWATLAYDPGACAALKRALALSRGPSGVRLWTNRLAAVHLEGFEDLIQPPEKILDEVRGRQGMFRDFLERGVGLPCQDERCRHCFLSAFCADLCELREKGRVAAHPPPACLRHARGARPAPSGGRRTTRASGDGGPEPPASFAWEGADTDIAAWARFFIGHRYVVKGSSCAACPKSARCAGAPIDLVRKEGFKILRWPS